jgi:hypothetical protein
MPTNKDLKRLVRARMTKTGESYTAARMHLLKRRRTVTGKDDPRPAAAVLPPDYAVLAGMKDATVRAKTGRGWQRWVKALDQHGATAMPHREIATLIHDKYKLDGWWAQMVTVGYERIRGLRNKGQGRDGAYEANKTKTVAVPLATLYRAFSDARTRARWLRTGDLTVRTATRLKSIRWRWSDGTLVQISFTAKGKRKSAVNVQHGKLPDKEMAIRVKAFWGERLDALATLLRAG